MAEFVGAFVSASLGTLSELLVGEAKGLLSVGADVNKIKENLASTHALLIIADRDGCDSPTLKTCIRQLQDLAFKAENLLERYEVEAESKKRDSSGVIQKFKSSICNIFRRSDGKEARAIISELAELTNKLESELGQERSLALKEEAERQRLLRLTYGHEVEPHFVGMEKDIELLVSKVKDESRLQRVVKIYGMGGLGKTTLARKVYNHTDLQSYARAWVCITQQFQPKAVFVNILKQLDSSVKIDELEIEDLVTKIHEYLMEKKCLVVIDDIWKDVHWECIRQAFPVNCNVIFTTRSGNIANQQSEPHKLKFLTEDEGWKLLQKVAYFFPVDADLKSSIEDIGRQIVSKCEGLPLSVCVIGGILRQKEHTLPEWRRVNVNMGSKTSYLRRGEGVEEYTRVKQVLDLSYNALPYYLKPCFLYLACFAEDEQIETERLYLLWMAEGFISYQDKGINESLRDVAQSYLTELAMRCLVQLHQADTFTLLKKFDRCGLHDLIHDLCSSKVDDEKFMRRTDASKYLNDIPSPTGRRLALPQSIGNSISRLAISYDLDSPVSCINGLEKLKDLRTFLFQKQYYGNPLIGFKESTFNLEMSQCLRIFVAESCEFEGQKLPNKVGKLMHLRYLGLRFSSVRELPKFVCSMPYLQTLDLRVFTGVVLRLPNVIWKMKRLKHLFLPIWEIQVIGGGKLRLDGLEELETLESISSVTTCIADIPKLVSLLSLYVRVYDVESMSIVLSNKNSQLRETRLCVRGCDLSSEIGRKVLNDGLMSPSLVSLWIRECNMSASFPYYKQGMCQNLIKLELYDCEGKLDVMEFGKYPMLQHLWLFGVEMTETLICHSNLFPQLKQLYLYCLEDLKKWEVEERAMQKLTSLVIEACRNLEKVPDGLRFISTLREMKIYGMPREFIERVKEEDYAPCVNIHKR